MGGKDKDEGIVSKAMKLLNYLIVQWGGNVRPGVVH